jgi:hypothetical protein
LKIQLYTSQSLNYFNNIGKYSLASALKYLPENVSIVLTTEDYDTFPKLNPRIEVKDLYEINNGFKEFQDRWEGKTMAKVINFAKKGYTVLYALENSTADFMIWLDADAFFKRTINEQWVTSLLDNKLGAQLGVMHEDGEFTVESGYFMMDLNHLGRKDFARIYRDYYDNDRCENMGRFYDSNVHGHALTDCEALGHEFVEMNLRKKGNTPIRGSMVEGFVGHFKGKVKHTSSYEEFGFHDYVDRVTQ